MSTINAATLVARVQADTRQFEKGMQRAESSMKRTAQRMQSIGRTMSAAITLPILGIGGMALKAAGDLEEMQGKSQAVFQDQVDDVREWASAFGEEVGRAASTMEGFATEFQDVFVPFGFARDEAAGLSKDMAELAVDLASFNNLAEDRAAQNLRSALVGNHEAARIFGSSITQARLDQELLNQGIEGGVRAADEQQKMLARMNIILSDTEDAQGDAARTADSFTNQMRRLRESAKEVAEEFGEVLLPFATELAEQLGDLAKGLATVDDTTKKWAIGLGAVAAISGPVLSFVAGLVRNIGTLRVALIKLNAFLGPAGWVILGLSAIVAMAPQIRKWTEDTSSGLEDIEQQAEETTERIKQLTEGMTAMTAEALKARLVELDTRQANLISDITDETDALVKAQQERREAEDRLSQAGGGGGGFVGGLGTIDEAVDASNASAEEELIQSRIEGLDEQREELAKAQERIKQQLNALTSTGTPSTPDVDTATDTDTDPQESAPSQPLLSREQMTPDVGDLIPEGSIALLEERLRRARQEFSMATTDEERRAAAERTRVIEQEIEEKQVLLEDSAQRQSQALVNSVQMVSSTIAGSLANAAANGTSALAALADSVKQLITQLAAAVAQALIFRAIMSLVPGGGAITGGGSILSAGFTPFAQGGLVTGPTLGLVGEGRGTTRSNPEVIAPLDRLQKMIGGGGRQQVEIIPRVLPNGDLDFAVSEASRRQARIR